MSAELRLGFAGAGAIVERIYVPIIAERPELAKIAAIYDPAADRAAACASRAGAAAAVSSLDALFARELDAIVVACPSALHASISVRALDAGFHVLCEKPMATSSGDAKLMADAARRARRVLMIGYCNRFRDDVRELKSAIDRGILGELRFIHAAWLRRSGIPGLGTWFTRRELSGGGALIDLGSHLADLAVWLGGRREITRASCRLEADLRPERAAKWYASDANVASVANVANVANEPDVETGARGFVQFEGGLDLFLEASWSAAVPRDKTFLRVFGTEGSASLETLFGLSPHGERPERPLVITSRDSSWGERAIAGTTDPVQPYRSQLAELHRRVRSGGSFDADLEDAIAATEVIDALYREART